MNKLKKKLNGTQLLLIFTFFIFCSGLIFFLCNDFWQDEVYTLVHFDFVPFKTTLFDYHSTNNHVLFNVSVQWFARIFGINDIKSALEAPYLLRLIPFLYSILGVVIFYFGARNHYGRHFAEVGVSIWCTSIVIIDFGVQLRGYSLSILLTLLQYFVFLDLLKNKPTFKKVAYFILLSGLSLLCLPTNIYINVSYLIFCFTLCLFPFTSYTFLKKEISSKGIFLIGTGLGLITLGVLLYYKWLLQLQPENPLLSSFHLFSFKNLIQAFAIYFHFSDIRYYLYLFLILWVVQFCKFLKFKSYSNIYFPFFCFSMPFLLFFIHGSIIIQRTFLSLFPFFVIIVTSTIEKSILWNYRFKKYLNYLIAGNIFSLIFSFAILLNNSKRNNEFSLHQHDLRNHYYLVNFNAEEVTLLARKIILKNNIKLFVWDDFGQTGIDYYLNYYDVPFEMFTDRMKFEQACLVLTNNKGALEMYLQQRHVIFKRLLNKDKQYNLYLLQM
ncbi:hypothetical protein OCK74_12945 [Chitinophagaceae bacterium LB-8]|uniref:Glycosyltransferase RgtA/B/C/D-like domain-containing protein n=1 Tax=Paraflavisolibacter caeni TaxID=2982496 RepID=A0A9X3BHQ5_9BACT|nr:hypothetical protein [Paraflavisolibacter caeni]MCU7550027.1 hypothetical protein [Paraflavisolibacter caeni]